MALWMVRAGRSGEREEFALETGVAAIGWDALPDMSGIVDRAALGAALAAAYPEASLAQRRNWESQLWPFLRGMQPGDWIALPLKRRPAVAMGQVTGPYAYRANNPTDARHTRPVNWRAEIPRSAIDQDLRFSLGAFMTVCRIERNDAESRLMALATGQPRPTAKEVATPGDAPDGGALVERDLAEDARDQLRAHIQRRFTGHALTRLVAAVLEAQGYRTRVSPEGADGGVDIVAGRGALGFEAPRLVVQVKSGDSPVAAPTVRELRGAMEHFRADQGLFVAWVGYKQGVEKENAREFFRIRLWTGDDLIAAIEEHYDTLSEQVRAELPLQRIWALVPDDIA
jgi:restriction system protein